LVELSLELKEKFNNLILSFIPSSQIESLFVQNLNYVSIQKIPLERRESPKLIFYILSAMVHAPYKFPDILIRRKIRIEERQEEDSE